MKNSVAEGGAHLRSAGAHRGTRHGAGKRPRAANGDCWPHRKHRPSSLVPHLQQTPGCSPGVFAALPLVPWAARNRPGRRAGLKKCLGSPESNNNRGSRGTNKVQQRHGLYFVNRVSIIPSSECSRRYFSLAMRSLICSRWDIFAGSSAVVTKPSVQCVQPAHEIFGGGKQREAGDAAGTLCWLSRSCVSAGSGLSAILPRKWDSHRPSPALAPALAGLALAAGCSLQRMQAANVTLPGRPVLCGHRGRARRWLRGKQAALPFGSLACRGGEYRPGPPHFSAVRVGRGSFSRLVRSAGVSGPEVGKDRAPQ